MSSHDLELLLRAIRDLARLAVLPDPGVLGDLHSALMDTRHRADRALDSDQRFLEAKGVRPKKEGGA